MRLVLFDCDGTIADTFGLIVETMRRCFESLGLPEPDEAAIHGIIGLSLDRAIHQLAPTLTVEALPEAVEAYRASFHLVRAEAHYAETLFPGAEALLRRLAACDDILVGMVTGKSRRGVRIIVEAHGLEGIFLAVRTADDCPSKPSPDMVLECCSELGVDPSRTLVVGDAIYDMQMARAAGAEAMGVSWGADTEAALVASGATSVAKTMDELARFIDRWAAEQPEAGEAGIVLEPDANIPALR